MAANKKQGYQEVICDDDVYIFKGDFSFLSELESEVGDLIVAYENITVSSGGVENLVKIMATAIKTKNGEDVVDRIAEAKDLISRNGLQECHILCTHILTYAMIGDVKKSELHKLKPNKLMQIITEPFLLESSRNRRLLWAYHLMISGISVCISFSLFVWLFQ